MEDYTIITADGQRWTRSTQKGAYGLADYLTSRENQANVYLTSGMDAGAPLGECLMYVGLDEDDSGGTK